RDGLEREVVEARAQIERATLGERGRHAVLAEREGQRQRDRRGAALARAQLELGFEALRVERDFGRGGNLARLAEPQRVRARPEAQARGRLAERARVERRVERAARLLADDREVRQGERRDASLEIDAGLD